MKNRYLDIIAFPVVAISIATLLVNGVSAQAATPDVQKIIDDRVEAEYAPAIVVGIVRNRQGKVDRLVLHQDGEDKEALKMNEPSPE